ncbi:MAG: hypothetical protein RhofKO_07190 [Rhodothermales bacterium]
MTTMPKPLFPPHIAWPTFIVSLLAASVGAGVWTVIQANSFGKAEVVADYHQQALDFDQQIAEQTASNALGWTSSLTIANGEVTVELRDRAGTLLDEAAVTVTPSRPESADAEALLTLTPVPEAPGRYTTPITFSRAGLWTFAIRAERGEAVYVTDVRRDVR